MGVARIFQRGGHTDSYIGYSPNCHLNIVGCHEAYKGGVTGTPGPPLATPLYPTQCHRINKISYLHRNSDALFLNIFRADKDECLTDEHDCKSAKACVNTIGSFTCSGCSEDEILDGDTCIGMRLLFL